MENYKQSRELAAHDFAPFSRRLFLRRLKALLGKAQIKTVYGTSF